MNAPEERPSIDERGVGDALPTPALDWVVPSGAVDLVYGEVAAQLRRRRHRRFASATLACAALLAGAVWWRTQEPTSLVEPAMAAIVSAPDRQVLSDGSVVELKPGASVVVEFSETIRKVRLQRGEAHFQVAKNAARPFIVVVGDLEVRAVGTAFSVELGSMVVEVLVTEGEVAVEKSAEPVRPPPDVSLPTSPPVAPQTLARLPAGNRVLVDLNLKASPTLAVVPVSLSEANQRLAWRAPRVDFSGASLVEVIAVFNQHARVKISIGDQALTRVELSGVLRADNVDSLLQLLADEFKIVAVQTTDGIVLRVR